MKSKLKFLMPACLTLILAFQNCSDQAAVSEKVNSLKVLADGGNGQHYGGKINPGRYVRPMVEKLCQGDIKHLGEIIVTETEAHAKIVDLQTCTYSDFTLDLRTFEHSEYSKQHIGYIEGIYLSEPEKKANSNGSTSSSGASGTSGATNSGTGSSLSGNSGSTNANPQRTEEVWCRKPGSSFKVGFDVTIRADYAKKVFSASTVTATSASSGEIVTETRPEQIVSRRFEDAERVRYKANGFDLDIRRRDYNPEDGTMTADFSTTLNGQLVEMSLRCRLGGELDVMLPKK